MNELLGSVPPRPRYATYWAPERTHPLWEAGCCWLGRDPETDATDLWGGDPPAHARKPWRYGFHATLRAPMHLAPGCDATGFLGAVRGLAAARRPFDMPALEVSWLRKFLALRPVTEPSPGHPLRALAEACIRELEPWRATPTSQELARWQDPARPASERESLVCWGDAHALSEWRFHMTLSDAIEATDRTQRETIERSARVHFEAALAQPLRAESLAVFIEPSAGAPFRLLHRVRLGG